MQIFFGKIHVTLSRLTLSDDKQRVDAVDEGKWNLIFFSLKTVHYFQEDEKKRRNSGLQVSVISRIFPGSPGRTFLEK